MKDFYACAIVVSDPGAGTNVLSRGPRHGDERRHQLFRRRSLADGGRARRDDGHPAERATGPRKGGASGPTGISFHNNDIHVADERTQATRVAVVAAGSGAVGDLAAQFCDPYGNQFYLIQQTTGGRWRAVRHSERSRTNAWGNGTKAS